MRRGERKYLEIMDICVSFERFVGEVLGGVI